MEKLKTYELDHLIERLFGEDGLLTRFLCDKMEHSFPKGKQQEMDWTKDWFRKQIGYTESVCPFTKEDIQRCLELNCQREILCLQEKTRLSVGEYITQHWNDV